MEGFFSHKNQTMEFAEKWIQLEKIILSELSYLQNDKCHIFSNF